jgi:hypothetical protein
MIHGKEGHDFVTGKVCNALFDKEGRVVLLVGIPAFRIYVYTSVNVNPFLLEAAGQSANAAE